MYRLPYGYFICPKGKIYPVNYEGHGTFYVKKIYPRLSQKQKSICIDGGGYETLTDYGWIRVTPGCGGNLCYEIGDRITKKTYLSAVKLIEFRTDKGISLNWSSVSASVFKKRMFSRVVTSPKGDKELEKWSIKPATRKVAQTKKVVKNEGKRTDRSPVQVSAKRNRRAVVR